MDVGDPCETLRLAIQRIRRLLLRKHEDIRLNRRDLPLDGKMSVESHRTQYSKIQADSGTDFGNGEIDIAAAMSPLV